MLPRKLFCATLVLAFAGFLHGHAAELTLPSVFSDHMVLQRDVPVPQQAPQPLVACRAPRK